MRGVLSLTAMDGTLHLVDLILNQDNRKDKTHEDHIITSMLSWNRLMPVLKRMPMKFNIFYQKAPLLGLISLFESRCEPLTKIFDVN